MKKYVFLSGLACAFFFFPFMLSGQQNVGVGTLTPASRLDVQGDNTTTTVINSTVNYSGTTDVIAMKGTSLPAVGRGIGGQYTGGYIGLDGNANGTSSTGSSYGVYGHSSGTAGIRYGLYGLASGGATNYGVVGYADGGAGYYGVYGYNGNSAGYAGFFSGRGFFSDDLNANDKVGIGMSAVPTTKLQILGGSDCSLTSNGFAQFGATNGWNLILDDNEILARNNGAGNDLFIQNDGGNVLMCASELGSVGIGLTAGTSIPTGYIFAVDGKIISEELRIQNSNNWPDYVFADHYPLMPLDDLKKSIENNNHLPNIPSAETVQQDGLLIGDMQKRMMEKIEELTLYVIKLNETNKQQQMEIDQLKEAKAKSNQ